MMIIDKIVLIYSDNSINNSDNSINNSINSIDKIAVYYKNIINYIIKYKL